jgi:ASC-1-like (ASCH) protein
MIKRIFGLSLLMAFVTVQANAATFNGLEGAFKEFSSTIASIDAQENQEAYAEATKKMNDAISSAQLEGMSNADLIAFATDKIVDPAAKASFEAVLTKIQLEKVSAKQARKLVIDALQKSYTSGPQWSPAATYTLIAVVFLAAAVAAAASGNGTVVVDTGYSCFDEYVCYDYYDYYWGWYTDCYWETVCY